MVVSVYADNDFHLKLQIYWQFPNASLDQELFPNAEHVFRTRVHILQNVFFSTFWQFWTKRKKWIIPLEVQSLVWQNTLKLKHAHNSRSACERHHEISSDHLNYRPIKYVSLESVIGAGSELAGKAFSQTLYITSNMLYLSLEIGSLHWPSVNLTVQANAFFQLIIMYLASTNNRKADINRFFCKP